MRGGVNRGKRTRQIHLEENYKLQFGNTPFSNLNKKKNN